MSVWSNALTIAAAAEAETTEMGISPMAALPVNNLGVVDANAKAVCVPLIHSAANSAGMRPASVNAPMTFVDVEEQTTAEASAQEMAVVKAQDLDAVDAHVKHVSANWTHFAVIMSGMIFA